MGNLEIIYYFPRSNYGKAGLTDDLPYPTELSFSNKNFLRFCKKGNRGVVLRIVVYEKTLQVGHLILATHCTSKKID